MRTSIAVLSLVLVPHVVLAQAAPRRNRGAAASSPIAAAAQQLNATSADEVRAGIEALGISGSPQAVEPLAARIRRGLPTDLLDVALDTLTVLGRPEAGPVLFELSTHRRGDVRLKAVSALAACKPRGADRALVTALSDQDERVRGAAAVGLGELRANGAADALFLAFEHGVLEAATAIGQVADESHVPRLLAHLGRAPFDALTPALSELLARQDVADRAKLTIIAALQELATGEARTFLEDFVAAEAGPAEGRSSAVRRAAEEAILRIAN